MALSITQPGVQLTGIEELRQSIRLYFKTPKGSICYRPDWGFPVKEYVDRNFTAMLDLIREINTGLSLWEPRIVILKVTPTITTTGIVKISVRWAPVEDSNNIINETLTL